MEIGAELMHMELYFSRIREMGYEFFIAVGVIREIGAADGAVGVRMVIAAR